MKRTVTAGGVVLGPDGRVLVVSQHGDSWSLPKGHVEPGETALDAARREIAEETGVAALEFVRELGGYERPRIGKGGQGDDPSEIKTIVLFLFRTAQTDLRPSDSDNPEARWIARESVAAMLTHPRDREFFAALCPRLPER